MKVRRYVRYNIQYLKTNLNYAYLREIYLYFYFVSTFLLVGGVPLHTDEANYIGKWVRCTYKNISFLYITGLICACDFEMHKENTFRY